jgi:hypothetical protein
LQILDRAQRRLGWFPAVPATVRLCAAELAGTHKTGTITRRLAVISRYHRDHN